MTRNIAIALVATSLLLAGCPNAALPSKGDNAVTAVAPLTTVAPIRSLNIAGAKSLFLAGLQQAAAGYRIMAAGDQGGIFRLNADNTVSQIQPVDASGSTVTQGFTPDFLSGVSNDFVYLSVKEQGSFVIRKSDGKAAKIDDMPVGTASASMPVKSDRAGNLYYAFGGKVVKVTTPTLAAAYGIPGFRVQAEDVLVKTELTNDAVETADSELSVDPEGSIIATMRNKTTGDRTIRLFKQNGGARSLFTPSKGEQGIMHWTDRLGNMYATQNSTYSPAVCQVTVGADGTITTTPVVDTYAYIFGGKGWNIPEHIAYLNDRTAFSYSSEIRVLKGTAQTLLDAAFYGYRPIQLLEASDTKIYALVTNTSGTSVIVKIDPETKAMSNLIADPNYQIFTMSVSKTDEVTVSALRMSDNTYILGKIDASGQLTVLNSTLPQVQQVLPLQ